MNGFDARIDALDVSVFDAIPSQSTVGDKRSWLALQAATRAVKKRYVYLEIGSYLGGSIQPHLLDPACRLVYSIDQRPEEQPDDRGQTYSYRDSSAERMLENLRALDPGQASKIVTFDADAAQVDSRLIAVPPDLCLIDGEHTESAVLSDFAFCARVSAADSIIAFHDANVVHPAIEQIVRGMTAEGRAFAALKLDGLTFAIARGDRTVIDHPLVKTLAREGTSFLREMRARRRKERVGRLVRAFVKRAVRSALTISPVPTAGSR